MNTFQSTNNNHVRVMWLAVALALLAALAYMMIAWDFLSIGDLQTAKAGVVIIYVAAGSYLLGGLLIPLRQRWLWIIGAVINALVILFFINLYQERPAVMFSPGGVATKVAQLLLEVMLIYLIFAKKQ
ncbi:MAG TPA: hypothetical protein VGA72_08310 [Anaerolineales bacterium]